MSNIKLHFCARCGVPHVPDEVAARVANGEQIQIDIIYPSGISGNVLKHGTGAINIDGCRIAGAKPDTTRGAGGQNGRYAPIAPQGRILDDGKGRWPANLIHDGSEEVLAGFPESSGQAGAVTGNEPTANGFSGNVYGYGGKARRSTMEPRADSGSAARFFYTVEKEERCALCRVLLSGKHAMESTCNATTAEQTSPTRSTLNGASAHADAAGSPPLESEGRNHLSNGHAHNAESHSSECHQPGLDTVQNYALTLEASRIVPNVRSAASLCASCETDIAQSLAATRLGLDPASLPFQGFISGHSAQILRRSLALYVAGRESTDTILTTESLKTLLGSVFHAIESTTPQSAGEQPGSPLRSNRIWYSSKADSDDRLGSKHPTVKPLDLMQYLCRLITPPNGTVLDCFAGTGTTGEAAWREGFRAILIEREPEYQADIARRMDLATKPAKRAAVAKSKNNLQGAEGTPLFGDVA